MKWYQHIKISLANQLRRYLRIENVFLVTALIFGGLLIFSIRPLHGNDEIVHFPRAYHVQEGHLRAEHLGGYDYGGHVPIQVKQFNDGFREEVQNSNPDVGKLDELQQRYATERVTDEHREPLAFTSASVYSAWSYAPQAVGIFAAHILDLPLNWYVYMGRIFVLLTYVLLTYFAIRIIPFGKLFLVAVALLPTALTQAVTLGMDGLVNGLSWLIIALTLAIFTQRIRITPKLLGLVTVLSLLLATTKQTYVPIAILPLLIPARLYPFAYKKVWVWRIGAAIALGAVSLWYVGSTSPINEIMHYVQRPGLHIDEGEQLHYVFQHPLQFLGMIFLQPFTIWSAQVYAGIVGVLTNRTIYLPMSVILLLYAAMGAALFHKERPTIAKKDTLFILAGCFVAMVATFVLINLALYASFTQVGHYMVEGLQGRYFLPLLPLIGVIFHIALPRLVLKFPDRLLYGLVGISVAIGLVSTLISLG